MVWAPCKNCGKETERHSKDFCITCYKKLLWKPKTKICKRCNRELPMHAKGLCGGCYNFVFHIDRNKEWNYQKRLNLSMEQYKKITNKCLICGFDKIVDLHNLDENNKNNSEENLIGLCPNHHRMLHEFRFRKEMREILKEKGFNLPKDKKLEFNIDK